MQISSFLYKKTTYEIIFPPDPNDPSYFLDLKDHLDKNLDYRRHRIEWRKGQPASWDMWRIKEEFFQMFCQLLHAKAVELALLRLSCLSRAH